ncbi:MAG: glutamate--tRNA ligase [Patescibacteria group bacterium]
MKKVRVRIAPSPTGFAHVGTAYISLFNFAFAHQNKGKFILRIEDTDVKRHIPEAEKAIFDGLKWLGLLYDEGPDIGGPFGPYRQSERLSLYQKTCQKLLNKKLAFEDEGAVRLRVPKTGEISWDDLVRGKISFKNENIEDFVLLKSDGFPTYNFACVVDDLLMKISHVIRAEEHISNTPRQLLVYQALGEKPPIFAHMPILRNPDRSKISKRENPIALSWYQEQGYLPEALINFLSLLGWSHPEEKDIFSLEEFIKLFSFERVVTTAPIFNFQKLDWLNGVYIRKKSDSQLLQLIKPFAPKGASPTLINQTILLVKERLNKLSDYSVLAGFFFKEPKVEKKLFEKNAKGQLSLALEVLEKLKTWDKKNLEQVLQELVKEKGWKTGEFFMNFRVAIAGSKITPPITDSVEILGREKTLKRLREVISLIKK